MTHFWHSPSPRSVDFNQTPSNFLTFVFVYGAQHTRSRCFIDVFRYRLLISPCCWPDASSQGACPAGKAQVFILICREFIAQSFGAHPTFNRQSISMTHTNSIQLIQLCVFALPSCRHWIASRIASVSLPAARERPGRDRPDHRGSQLCPERYLPTTGRLPAAARLRLQTDPGQRYAAPEHQAVLPGGFRLYW